MDLNLFSASFLDIPCPLSFLHLSGWNCNASLRYATLMVRSSALGSTPRTLAIFLFSSLFSSCNFSSHLSSKSSKKDSSSSDSKSSNRTRNGRPPMLKKKVPPRSVNLAPNLLPKRQRGHLHSSSSSSSSLFILHSLFILSYSSLSRFICSFRFSH